jgi:PIN domain nuclease of toxin-antitoxin system
MRILFDSHALFWFLVGSRRFSRRARSIIDAPDTQSLASAVSAWELANKVRLGKWPEADAIAKAFIATMAAQGIDIVPITAEHAQLAGSMAGDHRDPFDRMLAAQARLENVAIVTADAAFKAFGVKTIW